MTPFPIPNSALSDAPATTVDIDIFCADIGSMKDGTKENSRFGWCGISADGVEAQGHDLEELSSAVAMKLDAGRRVSLGFEAPMFAPFRRDQLLLTNARRGETNPNWIGGPGASVLATGLAQVPWILSRIRAKLSQPPPPATVDWSQLKTGAAKLFLWEAFVSGKAKGDSHVADARNAVVQFKESLPSPELHNAISEEFVFSLLGAALLRTGWTKEIDVLSERCLVIKAVSK